MKRIAEQACYILSGHIFNALLAEHAQRAWSRADRIERRWRIQGCTDAYVDRLNQRRNEWLAQQKRKHDALYPDRLSYLHR